MVFLGSNKLLYAGAFAALSCYFGWLSIHQPASAPAATLPKTQLHVKAEIEIPRPEQLASIILKRPLFAYNRRPARSLAPDPDAIVRSQLPARLVGVMINTNTRKAYFISKITKVLTQADLNGHLGSWTVTSILPGKVVLKSSLGEYVFLPSPGDRTETDMTTTPLITMLPICRRFFK